MLTAPFVDVKMTLGDNVVAEVLVEVKAKQIDNTFSYYIPEDKKKLVAVGKRVLVPFGPRMVEGFVLKIENKSVDFSLKEIAEVIDDEVVLNKELLELGRYISKKTMCNLISAYQTMLPSALKAKSGFTVPKKMVSYLSIKDSTYVPKNQKQKELMDILLPHEVAKSELKEYSSVIQTLLKKQVIVEEKKEEYRLEYHLQEVSQKPELTEEQKKVLTKVENKTSFSPFLLHGVTGSGKTEVYMRLIEQVLANKKEAIVLVPEISLTPQLVNTFQKRFGDAIAILHSRLSVGEKYDEWRKIARKGVSIVIGARSAIFAPFDNLGIIIVDEEHTSTYKQENNPKYHAVDIALKRAKYHDCPILLGSATPSLESYTRAKLGVYELLTMKKRIYQKMPEVCLIDMQENMKKGYRVFSKELKEALEDCFKKQEQAILLLNRRGYSTVVTCHECGYKVVCPNCEIPLTYHKKNNAMKCHYCNYTTYKPQICPECGSKQIDQFGMGTEKLEEEFKKLFPTIKTIRMDIDTTTKKGSHDRLINAFASKKASVLIGTQMIAKGLDFEDVTLVGVINGDASLNIPDFRSAEKTYSLLSQVAGRAGRAKKNGKVIIQGFNLNHYSIECASRHDYETFYEEEMRVRKLLHYPPYQNLALLKVISADYDLSLAESEKITQHFITHLPKEVSILGPTASALPKYNNSYYFQIILKYKSSKEVRKEIGFLLEKYKKNAKITIDVDLSV